jgi:hypothetical protein
VKEVTIGPDITQEQREIVQKLLEEYADCFALSIKEVNAIPGTVHKLNIQKMPPSGQKYHLDHIIQTNEPS